MNPYRTKHLSERLRKARAFCVERDGEVTPSVQRFDEDAARYQRGDGREPVHPLPRPLPTKDSRG